MPLIREARLFTCGSFLSPTATCQCGPVACGEGLLTSSSASRTSQPSRLMRSTYSSKLSPLTGAVSHALPTFCHDFGLARPRVLLGSRLLVVVRQPGL